MMPPDVSVVIINYNGGAFLQEAVNSVARQTFQNFELIVFDNASTDGSAEALDLSQLGQARLIRHEANIGFAAGNNRAAELARGRWLVLLNPDTVASPDWLEKLVAATMAFPACRTFTSAQLDLNTPGMLDGAGDAYLVFGFPWRGGFGRPASELPATGWCFSACGAAAMYDIALFREMGGFDERFFCYCEDVDLGFRLQLAGYDCLFVADATVQHAGSGISGRKSDFSTYHGTRNRLWTYFKNMPLAVLILTLPAHIIFTLYIFLNGLKRSNSRSMLRGLRDGIRGIPGVLKPSPWKCVKRRRSLTSLLRAMAWNPFWAHSLKVHVRKLPPQTISELSHNANMSAE